MKEVKIEETIYKKFLVTDKGEELLVSFNQNIKRQTDFVVEEDLEKSIEVLRSYDEIYRSQIRQEQEKIKKANSKITKENK